MKKILDCNMSEKLNVLVTGSAGFIGTNLIEKLKDFGHTIIMCDKKFNIGHLSANKLYDTNFNFEENIDFVFHLGAISDTTYSNRDEIMMWNYDFSVKLFNYCRENKIPFVYASSAATYGDGKKGFSDYLLPANLQVLNLYAETKNIFDDYALTFDRKESLCVGLKFFNVYGKYEYLKKYSMTSLIHQAINQISKTEKLQLFEFGQQKRDFVFIDDVVDVMLWFMNQKSDKNGIYNVGAGEEKSFNQLAYAIFKAMNKKVVIKYIKMPEKLKGKYQDFTKADITKLRKIGYGKIFTSLEDGARKTWEFYKDKNIDLMETNNE